MKGTASFRMYKAALLGRVSRLFGWRSDPYPPAPEGTSLSPSIGHRIEAQQMRPALAFPRDGSVSDVVEWQARARAKLVELTGFQNTRPTPKVTCRGPDDLLPGGLLREPHYLRVRPETDIPVHIIRNPTLTAPAEGWPVVVILVGSTSGVHLAWGDTRVPVDHILLDKGADLGLQAARHGYLAICIEQVGYGERSERALKRTSSSPTIDAANHALLLGRTLMGEKAMDVSATLDWLLAESGYQIDLQRLFLFGHSTGGTAALYASALEERFCGTLASGCIGPVRDTLMTRRSSDGDGIVPGLLNWFETEDLVAMCAPRPFVALSGRSDHIFPFSGGQKVVDAALPAFEALGAGKRLVATPVDGPHRYYAAESWAVFEKVIDPREPK